MPTDVVIPEGREEALIFITNPSGGWTEANLYAAYVMPAGAAALSSEEAMKRIEDNIDNVRERALGFVEFRGSGVAIPDGNTAVLETGIVR